MKNRAALATLTLLLAGSAHAQTPAPATPPAPLKLDWKEGPQKIALGHKVTLDLPADYVYLNPTDAKKLLERSGNFMDSSFLGMVVSKNEQDSYWVSFEYADEGHVKDDEKIDADALLKSITEGNEESNKERIEKGFPALHVDRWMDPPRYDNGKHQLVWALEAHSDRGKSVNFNTRVLGRSGVVSVNLITSPDKLPGYKPNAEKLLASTTFDQGGRYGDFDSKTDKVATYGLIGLIGGGAGIAALKIAKVGLLAKFGKVILIGLAKFGKAIALAFVALFSFLKNGVKRLFGMKPDEKRAAPPSMVDTAGNAPVAPTPRNFSLDDDDGKGGGTPPTA